MIVQKTPRISISILLFLFILVSACNTGTKNDEGIAEKGDASPDSVLTDKVPASNAESLVESKDQSKLNECQLNVQQILASCVANDYATVANLIMYRGADKSRMGFDSFNMENKSEAETVRVTCEVISAWLGSSKSYEFISFEEEETEFGLQYVVEVMFKKEKLGLERHFFYLMDSPKGKLLVNMV